MAFNPNNYKAPVARRLPVILLLDVSISMSGEKIEKLYDSVDVRLTLIWSKDPQGGEQFVKRIQTQNDAFRQMERILEAMQRVPR